MLFRGRADKAEALRKAPLFQNFSRRDVERIAGIADEIQSRPGEVLLRQGERGREFMMIVQGSVRVERDGKEIARRGAGEFLGEMAIIDGKPRSATVIAAEPTTLLVVHSRAFWPLLESVPGLQRKLLMTLSGRLRELEDSLNH